MFKYCSVHVFNGCWVKEVFRWYNFPKYCPLHPRRLYFFLCQNRLGIKEAKKLFGTIPCIWPVLLSLGDYTTINLNELTTPSFRAWSGDIPPKSLGAGSGIGTATIQDPGFTWILEINPGQNLDWSHIAFLPCITPCV